MFLVLYVSQKPLVLLLALSIHIDWVLLDEVAQGCLNKFLAVRHWRKQYTFQNLLQVLIASTAWQEANINKNKYCLVGGNKEVKKRKSLLLRISSTSLLSITKKKNQPNPTESAGSIYWDKLRLTLTFSQTSLSGWFNHPRETSICKSCNVVSYLVSETGEKHGEKNPIPGLCKYKMSFVVCCFGGFL